MDVQFSVVIPLYNKEAYVAQTLKSVVGQTYQNFEIIVVNDCSTDNSFDIVKAVQDHRIKIIEHNENKGVSASRNTGINAATHPYIAFLDADDQWDSSYLETIWNLVKEYPNESVFATHYRENYKGKFFVPKSKLPISTKGKSVVINDFFKINLGRLILTQSCIVVHKTVFEQIGYYDENITNAEDIDFYIRCFSHFDLAFNFSELSTINIRDDSLSKKSVVEMQLPNLLKHLGKSTSLDSFIFFHIYIFCHKLKLERKTEELRVQRSKIELDKLTLTQRLLLFSPFPFFLLLHRLKRKFIRFGIELNTYWRP